MLQIEQSEKKAVTMLYQNIIALVFLAFILFASLVFINSNIRNLKLKAQCMELAALIGQAKHETVIQLSNVDNINIDTNSITIEKNNVKVQCSYITNAKVSIEQNKILIQPYTK